MAATAATSTNPTTSGGRSSNSDDINSSSSSSGVNNNSSTKDNDGRGLDINRVRGQFPALGATTQIFFDNAGGTQTLQSVYESVRAYLADTNVQLGATYRTSVAATSLYTCGYEAAARYINAAPDEIVIGASTTQLFRNLSISMIPYLSKHPDAEIVVSMLDHEANIASWVFLAETLKLKLHWWKGEAASKNQRNLHLTPESLRPLLNKNTFLVACTHASNVLGTITPIREIAQLVHTTSPNALLCVDAVAYAPHRPVDVKALGADFYCFSWYKIYGPHCSQLYASRAAQDRVLTSLGHYFKEGVTLEEKLGLAGGSYELVQALPLVTSYLNSLSWPQVEAHEEALQHILLSYLQSKPSVYEICGEERSAAALRVPVVSFLVNKVPSSQVVDRIEKASTFGFRNGHLYSKRLVDGLWGKGDDGIVRVSMVHYNTRHEIQQFVDALDQAVSSFSSSSVSTS